MILDQIHNFVVYYLYKYLTLQTLSIILLLLVIWTFWGHREATDNFITLIKKAVKGINNDKIN